MISGLRRGWGTAVLLAGALAAVGAGAAEVAGTMIAHGSSGAQLVLPLRETDVELTLTAGVLEASVTQKFTNPTTNRLEAVYIFPLPARAAVSDMELQIGDRILRSQVKEKLQAKQVYEEAKKAGKRTALLEQERPNIFTTSVANIAPGEDIAVRLRYVEAAEYRPGQYSVTFPMVVGERYIPVTQDPATGACACEGDGAAGGAGDGERLNPPVLSPSVDPEHRLSLVLNIHGLPVRSVSSSTHVLDVQTHDDPPRTEVRVAGGKMIPNCEFHVDVELATSAEPRISVVESWDEDFGHALLTVIPPVGAAEAPQRMPRDVVFLIDKSGSMSGSSIEQARAGLLRCLDMLKPEDEFTIVQYSSDYEALSDVLLPATHEALSRARSYVGAIRSDGGTELQPALGYVLNRPVRASVLSLVVLLTDGDVGNEASLMELLKARLGPRRLFTFGIGSAPNEFLMREMAQLGRGQCRFLRAEEDVGEVIGDFFRTLDSPVLTDVSLEWTDFDGDRIDDVEVYPCPCPDVFVDRPLQVVARCGRDFSGVLTVRGTMNGAPVAYEYGFSAYDALYHDAIPKLFGRSRIRQLMLERLQAGSGDGRKTIEGDVLATALRYQLISDFTSRVVVEERLETQPDGTLHTVKVPVPPPRGWTMYGMQATATQDLAWVVLGAITTLIAAAGLRRTRNA